MGITNLLKWIGSAPREDLDIAAKVIERVRAERFPAIMELAARQRSRGRPPATGGIRDLAREELVRAGRALTYQEIAASIKAHRTATVNLESLRTSLARAAKARDVFSRSEDGRYGLLKWAESSEDDSAQAEDGSRRFAGVQ